MRSPHRVSLDTIQVLFGSRIARHSKCYMRLYSGRVFQEGDVVALSRKPLSTVTSNSTISKPLFSDGKTLVERGQFRGQRTKAKDSVAMNDIIGKTERTVVTSLKGERYMLHEPTLAEYINYCSRVVTPIYPQDASLIVDLLDLHPNPPSADNGEERLEIFEAGTGHGSLTLHLARAIHGGNTPSPSIPQSSDSEASGDECQDAYTTWRANRRAVVYSLDNSPIHSRHAQAVVRRFRRGMYFPHVDFHVGEIVDYLSSRLASSSNEPFLTHAVLDLPDPSLYLEMFGRALNPLGKLITFSPSITQTVKCLKTVEDQRLPFVLERVLEIGTGVGSGGRLWDVRSVLPRSLQRKAKSVEEASPEALEEESFDALEEESGSGESPEVVQTSGAAGVELSRDKSKEGWEMVCRPKAGLRIEGGGFVGVWKRMHFKGNDKSAVTSE